MALVVVLGAIAGVSVVGALAATCCGLQRYFRRSGGASASSAYRDGLDEERRRLLESDQISPKRPNEARKKREDTLQEEEEENASSEETSNDGSGPLPEDNGTFIASPVRHAPEKDASEGKYTLEKEDPATKEKLLPSVPPEANSALTKALPELPSIPSLTPTKTSPELPSKPNPTLTKTKLDRTPKTTLPVPPSKPSSQQKKEMPPAVAPKPKHRPVNEFHLEDLGSDHTRSKTRSFLVMPPGLEDKLAQRRSKGQGSSEVNSYGDFPSTSLGSSGSRRHPMYGETSEESLSTTSEAVSFDEPVQSSKLTHVSRNKGPRRRPPTKNRTPPPP